MIAASDDEGQDDLAAACGCPCYRPDDGGSAGSSWWNDHVREKSASSISAFFYLDWINKQ